MGISLASVRNAAKVLAQNVPVTGPLGVNLLLSDPGDFNAAIRQALLLFNADRPYRRIVDQVIAAGGFRVVLRGTGALSGLTGANAWSPYSQLVEIFYPWSTSDQGLSPIDQNSYRIIDDPSATVLEFLGDTLAVNDTLRLVFTRRHGLTEAPNTVTAPATAPTATLAGSAGNIDNGTHTYAVTFVTANGETTGGLASSIVTVTDKTTAGQFTLSAVPLSSDEGVTARRIYRTIAGNTGSKKLVGTLNDNVTVVFTDNVADASLGAVLPTTNTAGGVNTVEDEDEDLLAILAGSVILQLAANKAAQNTGNTNLPNDVVDRRSQSDIYRSRAKELREQYGVMVGRGKDADLAAHSAFGDLDTSFSDGRGFLWHGGR